MEQKDFDIYEILKGKTEGNSLYTPMCGKVEFRYLQDNKEAAEAIITNTNNGAEYTFDKNGKYVEEGEVLLFPSDKMRDWSKFAWKPGDVLVNKDGDVHIIFERFADDTYCSFVGKYYLWKENNDTEHFYENERLLTSDFQKAGKEDAQTYISTIEERLGGKLNRETLEVEKAQPEFKDGDIAFADYGNRQDVFIVSDRTRLSEGYSSFISLDLSSLTLSMGFRTSFFKKDLCKLRLATEEEKKQLFSALEKDGKAWDAGKKEVIDLKPKVKLKPFDKVLVRDSQSDKWRVNLFGYIGKDGYCHCVYANWAYCIPYEGNELLLGTSKDVEG